MSNQFTPGPWLIADEDKSFVYALGPQRGNSFWAHVQSAGTDRIEVAERWANARLIAAAPDLLEALQNALSFISCNAHLTHPKVEAHPIELHLRAAIKKATGES